MEIETDEMAEAITARNIDAAWHQGIILYDIQRLTERSWSIALEHNLREGNARVDQLADEATHQWRRGHTGLLLALQISSFCFLVTLYGRASSPSMPHVINF